MYPLLSNYIYSDASFSWVVSIKEFAHPALDIFSAVQRAGPTFFLAIAMFSFVFQISALITEKELKLRQVSAFCKIEMWELDCIELILFFSLTGNDNDGSLWCCILVIMAHMGGNTHLYFFPYNSTFWDDVPIWFLFEQQFCGCFPLVFPLPIVYGRFRHPSMKLAILLSVPKYWLDANAWRSSDCQVFCCFIRQVAFAFMLSAFISKSSSSTTVGYFVFIIGFLTQVCNYDEIFLLGILKRL